MGTRGGREPEGNSSNGMPKKEKEPIRYLSLSEYRHSIKTGKLFHKPWELDPVARSWYLDLRCDKTLNSPSLGGEQNPLMSVADLDAGHKWLSVADELALEREDGLFYRCDLVLKIALVPGATLEDRIYIQL